MMHLAFAFIVALPAWQPPQRERIAIETARYLTTADARNAWRPCSGAGPVDLSPYRTPDGTPALAYPCDLTRLSERAYWDREVRPKVATCGRITFWIRIDGDAAAVSSGTIYFRSGQGWYGAPFAMPEEGWQQVRIDRARFGLEGTPEGWNAIDGIRLSFWKGSASRATVHIGSVEAQPTRVVVVRNVRAGREALEWAERMSSALEHAGIDAGCVDDVDAESGSLSDADVAVYPFNPRITERESAAIRRFVDGGGRLISCYQLPGALQAILDVQDAGWTREPRVGAYSRIVFASDGPRGMPRAVRQHSWNITRVRPGATARVLARWFDGNGKPTGEPAITLSPAGVFVTHVLLDYDVSGRDQLLRALVGHYHPPAWREIADSALRKSTRLLPEWTDMTTALRAIRTASAQAGAQRRDPRLEVCLSSAAEHYRAAVRATKGGRPWDAVRSAEAVTATLTEAYARVQSPRPGEFRAVWCHSAYGIPGWTWEQSLTALRRAGFKAVVPNMLWGGIADYFSTVLPVSDQARARGDQIAQCLAAARKSGVEVHVWKVNWNLGTAPESFVARLRAQGRLQMDAQGGERPWLCPSDPANLALERDSMLEVARRYPVDGIHFDYIRYPDGDSCYCSGCRQRFETSAPAPTTAWPSEVLRGGPLRARFNEFRRSNITRLVRAVSDEVRRLPRKVRISAAVFPNWPACRDEVAQDWAQWVRDGLLDFVCPMDYTASTREFRTRLGVQRTAVDGRIPLYPGIGVSAPGLDVAQVIGQVRAAREAGLGGFILFNYDARTAREILPAMALGLTRAGRSPSQQRPPVR